MRKLLAVGTVGAVVAGGAVVVGTLVVGGAVVDVVGLAVVGTVVGAVVAAVLSLHSSPTTIGQQTMKCSVPYFISHITTKPFNMANTETTYTANPCPV